MTRPDTEQIASALQAGAHLWGRWGANQSYDACFLCGAVRRADDNNKPCKGTIHVVPRSEDEPCNDGS